MSTKLVSVVVPVYNGEKYIRDTLSSILDQTYCNIECIVVDDGSTDRTVDICKEFSGRLVILSKANGGQSDALNYGWQKASGDYLSYLSADDILHKNAIEFLVEAADKVGSEVVVYPRYELIDSSGKKIKDFQTLFFDSKNMFERFYCPVGPGAIFSQSLFEHIGGWRTDLRQIPDFEYWLRLAGSASFLSYNMILSSFRVHANSQTHAVSDFEKADESIVVAKSLVGNSIRVNFIPDRFLASAYVFSACLHLRSGRILTGIVRLIRASLFSPRAVLNIYSVKRIISSCTSLLRYGNSR
ncbi:glycosyl transferase [Pseudomonas sp. GM21]|uniref:glycosyltransferase n=1 Tax=Pseudomonas sp. GM21 TaxID=1144325 RepID=UPI0002723B76|nr:glycosyltransferase [Pseudomonas sp. GM21]EJM23602.1 glycosyl transferase [Pseudomonas sp. GM21]